MLRQIVDIEFDNMREAIAQKLSEEDLSLSEETLSSVVTTYADSLYSRLNQHIFNERSRVATESARLQIEKMRLQEECEEKLASKQDELDKQVAETSKYKRQLEEEQKECIRQKEWNQALVKMIKENGLELPKDIPHTYVPPRTQPNSDNSSLPPSKNPIGYKRGNRGYVSRPKSDKNTGGQPKHAPHYRKQNENPTEVVELIPERCSYCNNSLEGVEGKDGEIRQIIDIPEVINLDITNYKSIKKKCPHCGQTTAGCFPDGVNAYFSYGPRIIATVVLLCHFMNSSWNKIVSFFECMYGLHISEGTIGNILDKFSLNCEEDYQEIKEAIKIGKVVYADETVITKDGRKRHIWIFLTDDAVYMVYNRSRCMDVLFEEFPQGLPDSILVSDRYAAYFNRAFKVRSHQVCLPHLVRNCRGLEEKAPNCKWVKDFKDFIERAMKAKDDRSIDREKLFQERDELLAEEPYFCDPKERKKVIQFFKNMQKVKEYILQFLVYDEVPHNNNKSERGLRGSKSKLKQMGTYRTEKGPVNYVRSTSLMQSAVANGENRYDTLLKIAKKSKKRADKKKGDPDSEEEKDTT